MNYGDEGDGDGEGGHHHHGGGGGGGGGAPALADDDTPAPPPPPRIENITFKNIIVTSAIIPAELTGIPGSNITGLVFDNVTILDTSKTQPWNCHYVSNTTIVNTHPGPRPGTCGT